MKLNISLRIFVMPELFKSAPHIYKSIVYQRMMYDYLTEVLHIYSQKTHVKEFVDKLQTNISFGYNAEDRGDVVRKE